MKTQLLQLATKAKLLFIIFMYAIPVIGFTQNISKAKLSWQADQATDTQTLKTIAYTAEFKTIGSQSVEWIQKKGQSSAAFTVTATEGKWTDVTSDGSFSYLLERNGKTCKMTVERAASGTFITMDFSKTGEYTSVQRFRIQAVQKIN